jgi:two-component system, chemotaxis family, chemotaxis protein CheY
MTSRSINFRDFVILIAEPSSFMSMLIHGMLRGFGSNKVLEVRDSASLLRTLAAQKIDILICDAKLPPHGGLTLTRSIRRKQDNENRTVPILLMTSDGRETTIKTARDVGANMVLAKPISPGSLYDRLAWIALNPRQFVDTQSYFGPDRRFKIEGYPDGTGRRRGDKAVEIVAEAGPSLGQDDIDSLFSAARTGRE